jgi:hypothetical protein
MLEKYWSKTRDGVELVVEMHMEGCMDDQGNELTGLRVFWGEGVYSWRRENGDNGERGECWENNVELHLECLEKKDWVFDCCSGGKKNVDTDEEIMAEGGTPIYILVCCYWTILEITAGGIKWECRDGIPVRVLPCIQYPHKFIKDEIAEPVRGVP